MLRSILVLALAPVLVAQAPPAADAFAPVRFLAGAWTGEGSGSPGTSVGAATFRFELDGRVLVRRSHAEVAATKGRPAFRHEDLMTVFIEAGRLKAHYLDNEGHGIRYAVSEVADGVAFTSEPGPGPRFRLSYLRRPGGAVAVRFEIAPPDKPDAFSPYLEGLTRRAD